MSRISLIGQVLGGRYRIDEIVGQGGMSAVYKAYDPNLRRVVAVKTIHSHLADDPKFLTRFEEEATAVAQLRHPNIVQVFDFNHDGDLYYMVQEFLPGETLQERLRRLSKAGKRLPAAEALKYTIDISDAAGYAHLRGMIHRDIKPANIMLDTQGKAVLMDFGIVKITGSERHTATGAVVGTALYLPPEVIRGEAPDGRSDLYSLGVTLYEMVSGRPPFEADSAMTLMMMHLQEPVPNLRGLRPDVPEDLTALIEKMLAKDRANRFGSMTELAASLKGLLGRIEAGIPQPATQLDQPQPAGPMPVHPGAGTVLEPDPRAGAAPAAVAVASARPSDDIPRAQPAAASAAKPAEEGVTSEARREAEPGPAGPGPQKGSRSMLWLAGAAILVVLVLAGVLLAGPFSKREDGQPAGTATATPGVVAALVADASCLLGPSEAFPTVAQVDAGQQLEVLGLSADEAWWNVAQPLNSAASCWLPQGAVQVSGDISTLPLVAAPPLPAATASPSVAIEQISIDAEGRYVVDYAVAGFTEKLPGTHLHFFFNTFTAEQVGMSGTGNRLMYGGPSPFTGYTTTDRPAEATELCVLVADPDHSVRPESGNCLALPADDGGSGQGATSSGSPETAAAMTTTPPVADAALASSPASAAAEPTAPAPAETPPDATVPAAPTAVLATPANQTPTAATATPPPTATSAPPTAAPAAPRFGRLLFTSRRDGNPEIYLLSLAGGSLQRLTNNQVDDWLPDWSPDGSRIAFTSNRQGGYDTWGMNGDGGAPARLVTTGAWDDYPRWAPDGQRLALATTADADGVANSEIHIGRPDGGLLRLTNSVAEDQWPDWSPAGRIIYAEGLKGSSNWDLFVINDDGSGRSLWLGGPDCDIQPAWSPDGQWVAFIRNVRDTNGNGVVDEEDAGDLWVAAADGSAPSQLTFGPWTVTPAWSPDSRWIAVAQLRDSNNNGQSDVRDVADIWAVPLGGGDAVPLVQSPSRDIDPSWAW